MAIRITKESGIFRIQIFPAHKIAPAIGAIVFTLILGVPGFYLLRDGSSWFQLSCQRLTQNTGTCQSQSRYFWGWQPGPSFSAHGVDSFEMGPGRGLERTDGRFAGRVAGVRYPLEPEDINMSYSERSQMLNQVSHFLFATDELEYQFDWRKPDWKKVLGGGLLLLLGLHIFLNSIFAFVIPQRIEVNRLQKKIRIKNRPLKLRGKLIPFSNLKSFDVNCGTAESPWIYLVIQQEKGFSRYLGPLEENDLEPLREVLQEVSEIILKAR